MALFRRNTGNNDVPEDLQQYYSTSDGGGILKWVIRVVGGLIVLALLIWGGIWIGHKLSSKDPATATTNSKQQAEQKKKADEAAAKAEADAKKAADEAKKKEADAAKTQQEAQQKAAQEKQQQQVASGSTSSNGSSTSGSSSSSSSSSTQTQSNTQSTTDSSALPNTGPGENLAAIFLGASVLGTVAHMLFSRKRQLR
jgi:FtsZ-interacting cell division protein ZipA